MGSSGLLLCPLSVERYSLALLMRECLSEVFIDKNLVRADPNIPGLSQACFENCILIQKSFKFYSPAYIAFLLVVCSSARVRST